MAGDAHGVALGPVLVILAAGIAAVALFKRLGLGSVLGYLTAGLVIGPSGLKPPGAGLSGRLEGGELTDQTLSIGMTHENAGRTPPCTHCPP